jgi:hypothetical protein
MVDDHFWLLQIGSRQYPSHCGFPFFAQQGPSSLLTESVVRSGDGGPGNTCHHCQHGEECPPLSAGTTKIAAPYACCAGSDGEGRLRRTRGPNRVRDLVTPPRGRCSNSVEGLSEKSLRCHPWVQGVPRFLWADTIIELHSTAMHFFCSSVSEIVSAS